MFIRFYTDVSKRKQIKSSQTDDENNKHAVVNGWETEVGTEAAKLTSIGDVTGDVYM